MFFLLQEEAQGGFKICKGGEEGFGGEGWRER